MSAVASAGHPDATGVSVIDLELPPEVLGAGGAVEAKAMLAISAFAKLNELMAARVVAMPRPPIQQPPVQLAQGQRRQKAKPRRRDQAM
eukprot:6041418-Pyramimonas_sp.AAC.1